MNVPLNDAAAFADLHRVVALRAGYDLGSFVGQGSFKFCYRATDTRGQSVAFKILKPNAALDRNQRELAAMQACDHPNIARCLDSGAATVNNSRIEYVVEALFEGGNLQERTQRGPLGPEETFRLGTRLIDAVAHLYARDLVHRDIKPENIMFSGDEPVMTDFGIVRVLSEPSLTATYQPHGPGTPAFMPAEQYFNQKPLINWRADQFALGVTLGLSGFGIHPFGDSPSEAAQSIAARQPPHARFLEVSSAVGLPVLVKMIQPYPVQRYTSPAILAKEWAAQRP